MEQHEAEEEEGVEEDEAPLTRLGAAVDAEEADMESKRSARRPPKKEEAAKALAEAAKDDKKDKKS